MSTQAVQKRLAEIREREAAHEVPVWGTIPALLNLVSVLLEEREAAKGRDFNRCEYERIIADADAALARFGGEEGE